LAGEDEVVEEVAEDQHDEQHARDAHVDPAPLLEVEAVARAVARVRAARGGDVLRTHQCAPKTTIRCRGTKPANSTIQRAIAIQNMARCARGPHENRSIAMMRRPLRACRPIAATSATSPSPMRGVL